MTRTTRRDERTWLTGRWLGYRTCTARRPNELNGLEGKLVKYNPAKEMYVVLIDSTQEKKGLKGENLVVITAGGEHKDKGEH